MLHLRLIMLCFLLCCRGWTFGENPQNTFEDNGGNSENETTTESWPDDNSEEEDDSASGDSNELESTKGHSLATETSTEQVSTKATTATVTSTAFSAASRYEDSKDVTANTSTEIVFTTIADGPTTDSSINTSADAQLRPELVSEDYTNTMDTTHATELPLSSTSQNFSGTITIKPETSAESGLETKSSDAITTTPVNEEHEIDTDVTANTSTEIIFTTTAVGPTTDSSINTSADAQLRTELLSEDYTNTTDTTHATELPSSSTSQSFSGTITTKPETSAESGLETKSSDAVTTTPVNGAHVINTTEPIWKPYIVDGFPRNVTVMMGKTATLECRFTSDRDVSVEWSFHSDPRTSSGVVVKQNNTETVNNEILVIDNVTPQNQGWYKCNVSNSLGSSYAKGYLKVITKNSVTSGVTSWTDTSRLTTAFGIATFSLFVCMFGGV